MHKERDRVGIFSVNNRPLLLQFRDYRKYPFRLTADVVQARHHNSPRLSFTDSVQHVLYAGPRQRLYPPLMVTGYSDNREALLFHFPLHSFDSIVLFRVAWRKYKAIPLFSLERSWLVTPLQQKIIRAFFSPDERFYIFDIVR